MSEVQCCAEFSFRRVLYVCDIMAKASERVIATSKWVVCVLMYVTGTCSMSFVVGELAAHCRGFGLLGQKGEEPTASVHTRASHKPSWLRGFWHTASG